MREKTELLEFILEVYIINRMCNKPGFILSIAEAELKANGYPAYTTSAGWMGYSDEKIERVCELITQ